ncbi:NUDIX domain-containing protein [Desulfonatronovibrio magnus]|uniref:NUDIX domain-containing protein n=1 Tax=Desulfonatronovibrio magnus TaxID=698827 RepID=UPI0005EBB25D|nr:NUDIX hydrolase [Desulfonatronovibrio magnus]
MTYFKACPNCQNQIEVYRNPVPTVDIIIFSSPDRVVLIERTNYPYGWALPGGFVDYGETAENAAIREAKEETGLDVVLTGLLGVYSHPARDPRSHTLSVVYTAYSLDIEKMRAGDDAGKAMLCNWHNLPELAFDHYEIIMDFKFQRKRLEKMS